MLINFVAILTTCLAQNYTYQPWQPSMGSLTFNTLGDAQHPYVQCKTNPNGWNNPNQVVYPSNTAISNPANSATTHAIITSNQEDPCRCYQLGSYRHERYLPPSWDLDYSDLQDTVIRIGCGVDNSTCNRASQIEYWFYPEEQNSTLLVMFSFALINACTPTYNWHGVFMGSTPIYGSGSISISNPQFYIEVFDENDQLLTLGHYPTQASQGSANPIPNPYWPYSQFLAWPSGCNANLDVITDPDEDGVRTYYWAGQTNNNGTNDANGYATPTSFDYLECPESQAGSYSDGYPVQWFQYKPLAFNLKDIASQNVDANGNFSPVKSVKLRIHTVGCSATAHWAYGLFTAKMIPGIINADVCGDVSTINLSVPAGLDERTYKWKYGYDSTNIVGLIDPTSPITGVSIPSVYGISIDQNAQENAGHVWPYYRCEMRSYTGVPFVYEAFIKKYYLEPNFTFKQKFDNCDLRAQLIDSSLIYIKTPPTSAGGNWGIDYQQTHHIQWFVKNYQTSQPNNDRFDSIPNRYGDTNFTYVFNYPYIDTLTGEAFVKIVIQDSLQKCIKDTIKRIQLDLKAIRDTLTYDTIYTCEEKMPYVFDRAYFGENQIWNSEGTRRVTYNDTAWNGCDSIVDVTLIVRKPKVEITSDPDFCEAFSTNLTAECAETVLQYKWENGETSPSITIDEPGRYSVEIINKDSCSSTGSIVIPACKPYLNLPNSFSPSNQDGLNDYFYIPQRNLIKELEFTVFNRHGVMIYHTTNKEFEWNGTENGKLFMGATYNYILRIVDYEGVASVHKGSVTIF